MEPAGWLQHVEECANSHREDERKQAARALTIEFSQPLVQAFRRKRPRRRGRATPLFDPKQLTIEGGMRQE